MFIDTHLHLIDKSALSYPWLTSAPALDRDFLYETYQVEALRCGIEAALHMEVDVASGQMQNETDYIRAITAQSGNFIKGAIAACRPEESDFPAYLGQQQTDALVKGFRRPLHTMPDELSEDPMFRQNLRLLSGTGLTFDLCVLPHQISKAAALADLVPDVQFILDHCGVPDIASGALSTWSHSIADIAQRQNVTCKISGIVAYTDAYTWSTTTLRPYFEHVVASFGWDRVVWGSDWPVCTLGGGLSTWVATTHALLSGCSESERGRLMAQNARKIWNL